MKGLMIHIKSNVAVRFIASTQINKQTKQITNCLCGSYFFPEYMIEETENPRELQSCRASDLQIQTDGREEEKREKERNARMKFPMNGKISQQLFQYLHWNTTRCNEVIESVTLFKEIVTAFNCKPSNWPFFTKTHSIDVAHQQQKLRRKITARNNKSVQSATVKNGSQNTNALSAKAIR